MWHTIFFQPLVNALIFFYQLLGSNLGWAIIGLTVFIRGLLTPLTTPSLKSAQKLKQLQPQLNQLKQQYGKNKQLFAQKQLEFYKQHGVNPAAGCLPQIIQIVILIALFQAFNQVLQANGDVVTNLNQILYPSMSLKPDTVINTRFLYLDLTKPDMFPIPAINLGKLVINKFPGIFLIAAAVVQFASSKMMLPAAKAAELKAKKTAKQTDDMAVAMQQQMLYFMPLMTLVIGFRFPSGLVLYWLTFSVVMFIQQLWLKKSKSS